jgi:hypothetical protein
MVVSCCWIWRRSPTHQLNFALVLAVWDRISSTEAVALVAAHIQHPRHAPIPATELASTLLPSSAASLERYPPQDTVKGRSDWVFEDDNVATHLIKNSLAGSDAQKRNQLISMRAPMSRWLRDDITCTWVFLIGVYNAARARKLNPVPPLTVLFSSENRHRQQRRPNRL